MNARAPACGRAVRLSVLSCTRLVSIVAEAYRCCVCSVFRRCAWVLVDFCSADLRASKRVAQETIHAFAFSRMRTPHGRGPASTERTMEVFSARVLCFRSALKAAPRDLTTAPPPLARSALRASPSSTAFFSSGCPVLSSVCTWRSARASMGAQRTFITVALALSTASAFSGSPSVRGKPALPVCGGARCISTGVALRSHRLSLIHI